MVRDLATGRQLPDNAITRVLYATTNVHIYQIPPLTSSRITASDWSHPARPTAREIFLARLRVIETSVDSRISVVIALEDAESGELFAAAPYTSPAVVQPAADSSRFFAIRVQGDGGMKATLGMGFEDRSPAFDFGIALNDARKVLGLDTAQSPAVAVSKSPLQDLSLKDGEKIHIQLGGKGTRQTKSESASSQENTAALFSIAPPSASKAPEPSQNAKDFGFDDGEFGEFQ